jgi:hypothetical protein
MINSLLMPISSDPTGAIQLLEKTLKLKLKYAYQLPTKQIALKQDACGLLVSYSNQTIVSVLHLDKPNNGAPLNNALKQKILSQKMLPRPQLHA